MGSLFSCNKNSTHSISSSGSEATDGCIQTFTGHQHVMFYAGASPSGDFVVTASGDGTAKVWRASDGKCLVTYQGHTDIVCFASFSPCNEEIIVSTSRDGAAHIWDAKGGKCLSAINGSQLVSCACFSHNGEFLVTAGWDIHARIWRWAEENITMTLNTLGHTSAVNYASFSPNDEWVVTASNDKMVKIWNVSDGRCVRTLVGHSDAVFSACFSPCGTWIVTACRDKTAKLWLVETGELAQTLQHDSVVRFASFSPSSDLIVTGCGDASAKIWRVMNPNCCATFPSAKMMKTSGQNSSCLGHESCIYSAMFTKRGGGKGGAAGADMVLTASGDSTAKLWRNPVPSNESMLLVAIPNDLIPADVVCCVIAKF